MGVTQECLLKCHLSFRNGSFRRHSGDQTGEGGLLKLYQRQRFLYGFHVSLQCVVILHII